MTFNGCALKSRQTDPSVDLHLHTHHSDGSWSPQELVCKAIELKLNCIAITDHDTINGIAEAIVAAAGRLRIIPGIELNTVWTSADGRTKDIHVLGYYIDQASPSLSAVIYRQQEARMQQIEETLHRFQESGINITLKDVKAVAGKGSLGRPHLSMALLNSGAVDSIGKAYDMLMKQSSPFYVKRKSVSPFEAIDAIKEAGGLSSWAHPGKDKDLSQLLPLLQNHGLNGIEVYHRSHSHRLVRKFEKLAREFQLLLTGGSDCHGPYKEYPPSVGTVYVPPAVVSAMDHLLGGSTS